MALVNYDNSDDESVDAVSDEELEDNSVKAAHLGSDHVEPEIRMRMPKSAKLPSLIPNLQVQKSKTGKILLSVPTLETLDSSSDEDDSSTPSAGASNSKTHTNASFERPKSGGLLALLPPARCVHSRDGPKPTILMPSQLTVKRSPVAPKPKEASEVVPSVGNDVPTTDVISDESDVEESSSSTYFSFYTPSDEPSSAVASVRAAAALRATTTRTSVTDQEEKIEKQDVHAESSDQPRQLMSSFLPVPKNQTVTTPSLCSIDPGVLKELDVPAKETSSTDDDVEVELWTEQTFVPGPERKRARLMQPGYRTLPVSDLLRTSNQPIREVNQSDLTAGADIELMKSVTSDESQYVSQRAIADDDPGKLAHRKHQITWLAHQAQANEMELEKRWAEARRNKASNRAKYGF